MAEESDSEKKLAIKMNKIRLHYFFSQNSSEVKNFLSNIELELRITNGADWN